MTPTSQKALLPAEANGDHISMFLAEELGSVPPGRSSVIFQPGRAASANASSLVTILVILAEVDDYVRDRTYRYLHAMQTVAAGIRPALLTDGVDLRAIRRHGWFTEHVMSRSSHDLLVQDRPWEEALSRRARTTADRLDVAHILLVGPGGVSRRQHDALMSRLKQQIPFSAVVKNT